jgi:hypothetical protein
LAEVPTAPEELLYLWHWWREMFTGERLTYTEMKSFSDLTGANIQPGEVAIIRKLDLIYWGQKNG